MKKAFKQLGFCMLLLIGSLHTLSAQQAPDQMESLFDQMEEMMHEFSQGSFFQMDTMFMKNFGIPGGLDSLDYNFNWDGNTPFPMFFFSDTLTMDPSQPGNGFDMDLQGLMEELNKSLESLDPSYLKEMEELLHQFRSNGIVPDEEYSIPGEKPKKKKRVYKI